MLNNFEKTCINPLQSFCHPKKVDDMLRAPNISSERFPHLKTLFLLSAISSCTKANTPQTGHFSKSAIGSIWLCQDTSFEREWSANYNLYDCLMSSRQLSLNLLLTDFCFAEIISLTKFFVLI